MSCCCSGGPNCCARTGPATGANVGEGLIGQAVELASVEAKCEPTEHHYTATKVESWGNDVTVLFCARCGTVRKVEVPA